jgi:hypothetical protein
MAENIGWVLIHRQIQDHWIWHDANKFKWWIDMLLTVNTKDARVPIGNEVFDCKRGQSLLSIQSWASRWHVSKDTARNFLTLLEKDKMIVRVSLGKTTRLTICNYECYQKPLHVKKPAAVRTPDTNKEVDNENNINDVESQRVFRENEFKKSLSKFIKTEKNPNGKYSVETAKAFYENWSQWDLKINKMKFEKQDTWELSKRLSTWKRKEDEFKPQKKLNGHTVVDQSENYNLYGV